MKLLVKNNVVFKPLDLLSKNTRQKHKKHRIPAFAGMTRKNGIPIMILSENTKPRRVYG